MTTVRNVLTSAIALIERGWSQNTAARRANGFPCGPTDTDATCWCLTAALYRREDYQTFSEHAYQAEKLVREVIGLRSGAADEKGKPVYEGTTSWNDDPKRTVAEVLAALRAAEALAP